MVLNIAQAGCMFDMNGNWICLNSLRNSTLLEICFINAIGQFISKCDVKSTELRKGSKNLKCEMCFKTLLPIKKAELKKI